MAERLINAADNILSDLAKKAEVSKEKIDELEAASEDMKRIIADIKNQHG